MLQGFAAADGRDSRGPFVSKELVAHALGLLPPGACSLGSVDTPGPEEGPDTVQDTAIDTGFDTEEEEVRPAAAEAGCNGEAQAVNDAAEVCCVLGLCDCLPHGDSCHPCDCAMCPGPFADTERPTCLGLGLKTNLACRGVCCSLTVIELSRTLAQRR